MTEHAFNSNIIQEKLYNIGDVGHKETPSKTRKRGAAVLLLAAGVSLGALKGGSEIVDQFNGAEASRETHELVVKPGDTYWKIAQDIPSNDVPTGEKVHIISNMNEELGELNPGETVIVPDEIDK